jgi:hypothetical protein
MRSTRIHRLAAALPVAAIAAALVASTAQAHVLKDFGPYSVALGWVHEPTYVGQLNAVQVVVKDQGGKPVTDLAPGDLKVVVTVGGESSSALDLVPMYDEDTGLGVQGDYEVPLVPTVPGDYTFHLTGSIHGTAVDETATSSDSTFNAAGNSTDVQFPVKVPTITEIATRLDRLDARIAALASAAPVAASAAPVDTSAIEAAQAAAAAAQATAGSAQTTAVSAASAAAAAQSAANQARDAASMALIAGILVGALGVILGAAGLFAATRSRAQSEG